MPYKERDAFHRHQREWLNSLRPKDADLLENQNGIVGKLTIRKYERYVEEAGDILGFPNPKEITSEQMKSLESEMIGVGSTIGQKTTMVRAFLLWCGNKGASKWRISVHQNIQRGGIFLREPQVAKIRNMAKDIGLMTELIYSLGVDNGLRSMDMCRLTVENAEEFIKTGESEILGKGRNGGKVALQHLNKMTAPLLQLWMKVRCSMVKRTGTDTPYLLCRVEHRKKGDYLVPLTWDSVSMTMENLSEQSGIKFKTHDLRRTCGNRLWRRGVPIETIASILRHEDCGTTFRAYIGVQSDDMRAAMDKLSDPPEEDMTVVLEGPAKDLRVQELLEELLVLTGKTGPSRRSQA
ncbi:MAG: site-specific integrase [Methanomassiliicoccales archaeon]